MAKVGHRTGKPREPSHRKLGSAATKARKPQRDTMTIERLAKLLSEPGRVVRDDDRYPKQQEALERRKDAIRKGDLLALYSALNHCFWPARRGFSFEDAHLNPDLNPRFNVCEVPAWLLGSLSMLLWCGIGGEWPKGRGRQATASQRHLDAARDLVRAWKVLRAREQGLPWDQAHEHVSKTVLRAGGASTVADAYERVVRNLRRDPDYYRRLGYFAVHLFDATAGLPYHGDLPPATSPKRNRSHARAGLRQGHGPGRRK